MKYYIPVFFSLVILGCSANNNQNELVHEMIAEKLEKNGPFLFCDQPGYSACYDISHEQCLTEVSEGTGKCTERTKNKFGEFSKSNAKEYTDYYKSCVILEHGFKYPSRMVEIDNCLKSIKVDKDRFVRSLLK